MGEKFKFFLGPSILIKEIMYTIKFFLEDLGLLIVKKNLPIQFVESMWLKHLIL